MPNEEQRQHWGANHTRGPFAVGGGLWLTNARLVFVPHWFERRLRRREWTCDLATITGVGVAERGPHPGTGAWRRRLVVTHDGDEDYFVVNDVEVIVASIQHALDAP